MLPRFSTAQWALAAVVVVAGVWLWIMPLNSSFWLDECGTAWAISGGAGEVFRRSLMFLQSPLYCYIAWLASIPFGASEWSLRAPSLVAICVAGFLLYRLGSKLFDRETGLLAIPIFLSVPTVAFAGVDARPYAAALIAVIAAMWALIAWFETRTLRHGILYAIAAALTIHLQLLFGYMILIHAVYAVHKARRTGLPSWSQIAATGAAGALLVSPLVRHLRKMLFERGDLSLNDASSILVQVFAFSGMMVAVFVVLGLAAAVMVAPRTARGSAPARSDDARWVCVLWAAGPVVLLLAIAQFTGVNVFVSRYLIPAAPGLALLLAHFLRGMMPERSRYVAAAVCLCVATLVNTNLAPRSGEDWRSASKAASAIARPDMPLLLYNGLLETASLAKLDKPEHQGYLALPLAPYPVTAPVLVLPYDASPASVAFVRRAYTPRIEGAHTFLVMLRNWTSAPAWLEHIRSEHREFTGRRVWASGGLSLWRFDRLDR